MITETSYSSPSQVLSPRQLAQVIGASESSLKRWIDGGQLIAARTTGGHRRVTLAEAIRFIRDHQHPISDPTPLGLAALDDLSDTTIEQRLDLALRAGDGAAARTLLVSAYAAGMPIAQLCDGPLRAVMERIGELFHAEGQAESGIAIEHQATSTCLQALHHLHAYLPAVHDDAPVALGGAPTNDPYLIPSLMASVVFSECGYRTFNLGPQTPLEALRNAALRQRPKIVWLSVSTSEALNSLRQPLLRLADELATLGSSLIVGGRHSHELGHDTRANLLRARTLTEATSYARGLLARR